MKHAPIFAAFCAALLGGCTVPLQMPVGEICRADRAIGYIGQRYTVRIAKIVKAKTHAHHVRMIAPDMAITQEFRGNRVNLELDGKNIVTRIYCG